MTYLSSYWTDDVCHPDYCETETGKYQHKWPLTVCAGVSFLAYKMIQSRPAEASQTYRVAQSNVVYTQQISC